MSEPQLDRHEMSLMQKLSLPETADPPWSILVTALIVAVLFLNLTLVGSAIASILLGIQDSTNPTPFLLLLSWTIGQTITIAYVIINRRSSYESWYALKLSKGLLPLPIVLMVGVAIALTVESGHQFGKWSISADSRDIRFSSRWHCRNFDGGTFLGGDSTAC